MSEAECGASASADSPAPDCASLHPGYLLLHLYGDRVLVFDSATAEIAGALSDLARSRGHAPGFADIVIAATALRHDLVVLSHNERHFTPMGAVVIDPFKAIPPS